MFDWLKRLFGEGRVRFRIETYEDEVYIVRASYIGHGSLEELKQQAAREFLVETGLPAKSITIEAMS